jgi:hypothetical protein
MHTDKHTQKLLGICKEILRSVSLITPALKEFWTNWVLANLVMHPLIRHRARQGVRKPNS